VINQHHFPWLPVCKSARYKCLASIVENASVCCHFFKSCIGIINHLIYNLLKNRILNLELLSSLSIPEYVSISPFITHIAFIVDFPMSRIDYLLMTKHFRQDKRFEILYLLNLIPVKIVLVIVYSLEVKWVLFLVVGLLDTQPFNHHFFIFHTIKHLFVRVIECRLQSLIKAFYQLFLKRIGLNHFIDVSGLKFLLDVLVAFIEIIAT
jgi:hypothetical protein